jgi:Spy/CpxP family protein refolding chaperone
MLTDHRVGIDAIFIVAILLLSGASSTFSSIYGSTNVTAGIAEQSAMENHFDHDIDSASSSPTISSQSSPYTGQEVRDIKSLSDNDIQSLQNGTGEAFGGMAKLAELNGYPGPRHVLDMASELQLTDKQRIEIERIYQNMSNIAKSMGEAIIATEQDMDEAFGNNTITQENLKLMLDKSAELYGQLRLVHLSAHLDIIQMLTKEQVQMYNMMRGYDSDTTGKTSSLSNDNSSSSSSHHQH